MLAGSLEQSDAFWPSSKYYRNSNSILLVALGNRMFIRATGMTNEAYLFVSSSPVLRPNGSMASGVWIR